MALDFLPFTAGQKITAEILNELVAAIIDGSIFVGTSFVGDLVQTLGDRVEALENRVDALEAVISKATEQEQFILTGGQSIVGLQKPPLLCSQIVFLNGLALSKSPRPDGTTADYTLSGTTVTLETELAALIVAGDILLVYYEFEVTL